MTLGLAYTQVLLSVEALVSSLAVSLGIQVSGGPGARDHSVGTTVHAVHTGLPAQLSGGSSLTQCPHPTVGHVYRPPVEHRLTATFAPGLVSP